ncbi:uncharacterized protein VSU04_016159 isoform 3-T8 [Chlamydotis macqueenii]
MWNLKHGGGQPSGRSYRRGEKQKAASDLSDSPSSAGSESCASEAPRAAVAASDFLAMSGAVFHRGCPFLGHESTRWMERSRSGLQGRVPFPLLFWAAVVVEPLQVATVSRARGWQSRKLVRSPVG